MKGYTNVLEQKHRLVRWVGIVTILALSAVGSVTAASAHSSRAPTSLPSLHASLGMGGMAAAPTGSSNNNNSNGNSSGNGNSSNDNSSSNNNNSSSSCGGNSNGNGNDNGNDNSSTCNENTSGQNTAGVGVSTDPDEAVVGAQPSALDTVTANLGPGGGTVGSLDGLETVIVANTGVPILVQIDPVNRATDASPALPLGWRSIREFNLKLAPIGAPTKATVVIHYSDTDVANAGDPSSFAVFYYSVPLQRWVQVPATLDANAHTVTVSDIDVSAFIKFARVALLAPVQGQPAPTPTP